jgi:septal ring factor EnvC (AmiA/AmiB activator)
MALVSRRPGRSWTGALLFLALLWVSGFTSAGSARGGEGSDEELEGLRQAIHDSRRRVEGHEREERALFDRLEEIGQNLDRLSREVADAKTEARRARQDLREAQGQAEVISARLDESRRALSIRAVALYKAGDVGPIRILFSAESPRDFLSRVAVLRALVEYDADLVRRHRDDYEALVEAQRSAEAALERHDRAVARLDEQQGKLRAEREQRAVLLARVREDRVQERGLLIELERAARALEETVASLGEERGRRGDALDGLGFAERRGRLARPLQAKIARPYGKVVDRQFLTQTFRKGVDFDASIGDAVSAVAEGEVRFAGWFRGYGKIVIVDHGDQYFTVSGHLSEIGVEVGDRLAEGDSIGAVGDTGTLSGPSLYFEIRKGSEPQDPEDWFARGAR